jgi:hypothetical protein
MALNAIGAIAQERTSMTSLAALKDWLVAGKTIGKTGNLDSDTRLRALPKEEICLYVKAIDNRGLVRLADKRDWMANLGMTGGVLAASLMLIALLLPSGYTLAAGKRLEQMRYERSQLLNELKILRAREASLTAPDRLVEYAGAKFGEPTAAQVVFAPPSKGTVASLNKH